MKVAQPARITRQDIEEKIRSLGGAVHDDVEEAKPTLIGIAGAVAFALVILAYLAGRRSGRQRSAVVEIRRL